MNLFPAQDLKYRIVRNYFFCPIGFVFFERSSIMNKKSFMLFGLCLALIALVALPACNSTPPTQNTDDPWWENPGSLQFSGYISAFVGSAEVHGQKAAAEKRAFRSALDYIASSMGAEVQSLAEDWTKEAGDALKKNSQSSFYNNEVFQRTFVKQLVNGAQMIKNHTKGNTIYVLVGLRAADFFDKFQKNAESDLETLALTDVMKSDMRNRLDKMVKEKKEAAANKAGKWKQQVEGGKSIIVKTK